MEFKFDRTVFSAEKMSEQKKDKTYWLSRPPIERFQAAMYLNSIAYKFDLNNLPKMDKTVFSMEKRG